MLKLMIVDDEPMVIRGLCRQIDWQMHYIRLAGTAENANDALDVLKKNPVDILITDVCMPRMSGLELISAAKILNPEMRCVVISSYNEFNYVKKALQLGVDNYLLKPIDQWELDKTLEQLADNLRRKRPGFHARPADNAVFRNNQLDRWVHGDISDNMLYEKAELLGINPDTRQSQICVMELSEKNGTDHYTRISAKIGAFRDLLSKEGISAQCFIDRESRGVAVLWGDALDGNQQNLRQACGGLTDEDALHDGKNGLYICASIVYSGIDNIPLAYDSAVRHLNFRFLGGGENAYYISRGGEKAAKHELLLPDIQKALQLESSSQTQELARQYLQCLEGLSLTQTKAGMVPALIMYLCAIRSGRFKGDGLKPPLAEKFSYFSNFSETKSMGIWFLEAAMLAFRAVHEQRTAMHPLVQRVINIIHKRYSADCSLKSIAADCRVSSAYLGQLFKEETGEYFNDYLMTVRLQASQLLLLKTDLKVRDILYEIGISSQSYYNRVFKKAFGISPLSYRYINSNTNIQ